MRVDDLPFGGVHDRVGNVAGPALGHSAHGHHRRGRTDVAFAAAHQAFVEQLVEAQTGISVNMSAVKAAQAVDRDGLGAAVLLQDRLLGQIHRRRGFSRVSRVTPSDLVAAAFCQRSATARASSLSAAFQASFTSANGTLIIGMPMIEPAGPDSWPAHGQDLRLLSCCRRHSSTDRGVNVSGLAAQVGLACASACCEPEFVAATKLDAGSPCLTDRNT